MKTIPNVIIRLAVLASLAVALATSAQAASVTWSGGDMTRSQPDTNSWGTGVTYNSGDIAQFPRNN